MTEKPDNEQDWQSKLTPEQFYICREKGTEFAFTGKYTDCTKQGIYHCVCCDQPLFSSEHKFHSGCGWPSFFATLNTESVNEQQDLSHGMRRIEVTCKQCNAHLGHVFPDGPKPSGLRYCINSIALTLKETA